jgi:hypothetical protein
VKPCCGFASDLDQLTIGNIYTDTAKQVIAQGRAHPYVGKVFRPWAKIKAGESRLALPISNGGPTSCASRGCTG